MLMRSQLELARAGKTRKMWMETTRTPAMLQQAAQQAQLRRLSRGLRTLVVHAQSTSTQTLQQQQAASLSTTNGYKLPPKEILDIVDMPSQPAVSFSPDRKLVSTKQRCKGHNACVRSRNVHVTRMICTEQPVVAGAHADAVSARPTCRPVRDR
jgi:hypothetical protein